MKKYIFSLLIFSSVMLTASFAQSWSLTGNSGTNPPTNFLGTTDSKALSFKTSNTERMRIVSGGKIGIGFTNPLQKLDVNGNINIGKGYAIYMENHRVLRVDSINANIFLGNGAGSQNSSGIYNTGNGFQSLLFNSTGNGNTATGALSLLLNTTGSNNVANGDYALFSNTIGYGNIAIGHAALYNNTTGNYNVASGLGALSYNTTGFENVASGSNALNSNTTGSYNVASGPAALDFNTTGSYNTAVGYRALYNTTASFGNTAVGSNAGDSYNNGYYNTFIGSDTHATWYSIYNSMALGNSTTVTASNQVRIGNNYTTSIGGYSNWTNISDGRVKKNIKENVPGLAFINKLKPVTYNLDLDAADKIIQSPAGKDNDARRDDSAARGKALPQQRSQLEINARNAKQQILYTGFVAQDVEKAAKELNYDFSGVDAAKSDKDLYGLRYTEFVMPLVKAVQELSAQNDQLKSEIQNLKSEMDQLKSVTSLNKNYSPDPAGKLQTASLGQNTPNPFNRSTSISYALPEKFSSARIIINDNAGKALKQVNISGTGKGTVNIDASILSAGGYHYSLIVDGKIIVTKQMILAK